MAGNTPFQETFFASQPSAREIFDLFEYLPDAYFYAKDARHRYVGANEPVLREVFGLDSLDQLLGKTDVEFQPPALAEAYHAEDRRVMEAGQILPRQLWLVPHVRGAPSWYVSTKSPLRDPNGSVIGIVGVMYRVQCCGLRRLSLVLQGSPPCVWRSCGRLGNRVGLGFLIGISPPGGSA